MQGKTLEGYHELLEDALAIEDAGASFLLLEAMPPEIGGLIRGRLSIPTYGIGAGNLVDGQLVIIHDIIGLFEQFRPKFVKRFCEAGRLIEEAIAQYCDEVRSGAFPAEEQFYPIKPEELKRIEESDKRALVMNRGADILSRLEV